MFFYVIMLIGIEVHIYLLFLYIAKKEAKLCG